MELALSAFGLLVFAGFVFAGFVGVAIVTLYHVADMENPARHPGQVHSGEVKYLPKKVRSCWNTTHGR